VTQLVCSVSLNLSAMNSKEFLFMRDGRAMLTENLSAEYAKKAQVLVMLRGILEKALAPSRLNAAGGY
jgi:hypothetical protein